MKWLQAFFPVTVAAFLLILSGCASTGNSNTKSSEYQNKVSSNEQLSLEDYLRRLSGVRVVGTGNNIRVTIRSNMSISNSNEQPLFIVDGQEVGRSFAQAKQMVTKGKIKSVKAIPPSRASMYGIQGAAGVIIVKTE